MCKLKYFYWIQMGLIFPVLFITITASGYSQSATTASGGDVESNDGSVSFSVGQVFYFSQVGDDGNVSTGVQQTYNITKLDVDDYKYNFALEVFPNPTTQNLTLKIEEANFVGLDYKLLDLQGKLVVQNEVISSETNIQTQKLTTGTYILNIEKENQVIQSFKIIKE